MSRALQRLVEQREAAFRDEARRDAEEEDEAARRKREEEEAAEAQKRAAQELIMTRVLTRLVKRKLGDAVETWCVGLAERKSWLSRTTTTAPDSFATTGIFASTQSLGATFKSTREEASSYLDEIMRSPSLARASSARARSRGGRAASPEKSLRLADWNFSPPPPDRVVRRTTPAYPYSPPVLKDLTSNPLGGSVRAATPARGRRSPTKQPDFRPRAGDAARKEGPPHQEEETSTVLTPRRSPSPPPAAGGAARGPPAAPACPRSRRPRHSRLKSGRGRGRARPSGRRPRRRFTVPGRGCPSGRGRRRPSGGILIRRAAGMRSKRDGILALTTSSSKTSRSTPNRMDHHRPQSPRPCAWTGCPSTCTRGAAAQRRPRRRSRSTADKDAESRRRRRRASRPSRSGGRRGRPRLPIPAGTRRTCAPRAGAARDGGPRAAETRRRAAARPAPGGRLSASTRAGSSPIRSASSRPRGKRGRATTWPTRRTRTAPSWPSRPASVRRSTRRSPRKCIRPFSVTQHNQ